MVQNGFVFPIFEEDLMGRWVTCGGHHMLGDGHPRPRCPRRALPASTDTIPGVGLLVSSQAAN